VIENQSQQGRPFKVVQIRRGYAEDPDAALDRHFAAHPEDQGADVVIFEFCDYEEMAEASRDCGPPAGPACEQS
jgi:hypothetical protein